MGKIMYEKIKTFKDLIVWQQGHKLAIEIYRITKKFPREELYSLVDQLKRAAVSITSNIAEGFSRHSYKEKVQFYYLALGSLTELQNQIILTKDVGYITVKEYEDLEGMMISLHKLLNLFILKTKSYIAS